MQTNSKIVSLALLIVLVIIAWNISRPRTPVGVQLQPAAMPAAQPAAVLAAASASTDAACDSNRTVQVSGAAVVIVVPDRALLQLGVHTTGSTPDGTHNLNVQAIQQVIRAVRALGVAGRISPPLFHRLSGLRRLQLLVHQGLPDRQHYFDHPAGCGTGRRCHPGSHQVRGQRGPGYPILHQRTAQISRPGAGSGRQSRRRKGPGPGGCSRGAGRLCPLDQRKYLVAVLRLVARRPRHHALGAEHHPERQPISRQRRSG